MNQEENKETYVKYHKDENGNLHRLDGPAVEYLDGSGVVDYWVHGIRINQNSTYKAVQELFNNNKSLPNKIFKEQSDFNAWATSEESKGYTGLQTRIFENSFLKFVQGTNTSNNSAGMIYLSSDFTQILYLLNGFSCSKFEWEERRGEVFESDLQEIAIKSWKKTSMFGLYPETYNGNTTTIMRDRSDLIEYVFDLQGNCIEKLYYRDTTFRATISLEERNQQLEKIKKEGEQVFLEQKNLIESYGFELEGQPEYLLSGLRLDTYKNKTTRELSHLIYDIKNIFTKIIYQSRVQRSINKTGLDFVLLNKALYSPEDEDPKILFSYKDEFAVEEKNSVYFFAFPKQKWNFAHSINLRKELEKNFYFQCFIKDNNLNKEDFLDEIAKVVPGFNNCKEEEKPKVLYPPLLPNISNKTKEIVKRVAVKRISGIVASLVIQHVFGNLKKPEHQTIKNFFKTETGISLIKLTTAQLLPLLKTQLPEKYQGVYESIVEEFDIQSKVDAADGFINLVLETVTKDDFISFKFLENEKDESTGIRANPLALESPNTETLGVSIEASLEKEKILLEKE